MDGPTVSLPKWIQRVMRPIVMPMGRDFATFGASVALVMLPFICAADESWSASLGATSDYVYRGVSQTYGGGAVQLGANYQNPLGWFVGAWASNVDPYPGGASSKELDLYAGVNRELGADFTIRGTYTRYAYLQDPRPVSYDHDEIAITVAYLDLIAATVSYQPDSSSYSLLGFAHKRATIAYELTGRWPLRDGFTITVGAGYYDLQDLFGVGYWAGDTGLAYVHRRLTLELSRFYCDPTVAKLYADASANGTWVLSAVLRF
jgi:uncharacterized protein (TIGR02001 family)